MSLFCETAIRALIQLVVRKCTRGNSIHARLSGGRSDARLEGVVGGAGAGVGAVAVGGGGGGGGGVGGG